MHIKKKKIKNKILFYYNNDNYTYKFLKLYILKLIFIVIIIKSSLYFKTKKKLLKVCLCTIGKLENRYIREFVEHYKNYKVDKIFIYDNNEINGEKFDNLLKDYINNNFIEIINVRGKKRKQLKMFQNCYNKNYKKFDWLIFYDIDEFIYLKNIHNIKDFLNQKKFNKCQSIYLNWVIHTDNNLKYYNNRSLSKRFTEIYKNKKYCNGKTIIRGNIENIKIETTHLLDRKIERCNGFGKAFKAKGIFCLIPDYNYYYINHYYSKSTEEFINKVNKGDAVFGNKKKNKYSRINFYFKFNKITYEKIKFIGLKMGLNISKLMEKYIK